MAQNTTERYKMGRLTTATRFVPFGVVVVVLSLLAFSYSRYFEVYDFWKLLKNCQGDGLQTLNTKVKGPFTVKKIQLNGQQTPINIAQPFALKAPRTDVMLVTPWQAPIVWEGSFDPKLLDAMYKPLNLTIGVTVFAIAKYTRFLKNFLESAEKYFLQGYKVNYYVFTDRPKDVPLIKLKPGQSLVVFDTVKYPTWQEISLRRMEIIHNHIVDRSIRDVDYIYCLDVDLQFTDHSGAEIFAPLVAFLHPGYYNTDRNNFPYERRPKSRACVPRGQGHFYYAGGAFGGTLDNIVHVTAECVKEILVDKAKGVEAAWQEESHLNKYFVTNLPHKLLSMEYLCNIERPRIAQIKVCRISTVRKNHAEVRRQD